MWLLLLLNSELLIFKNVFVCTGATYMPWEVYIIYYFQI
jgi:hypothetical protein